MANHVNNPSSNRPMNRPGGPGMPGGMPGGKPKKNKLLYISLLLIALSFVLSTVISLVILKIVVQRARADVNSLWNETFFRSSVAIDLGAMFIAFVVFMTIAARLMLKGNRIMAKNVALSSYGVLGSVYEGMYLLDVEKNTISEIKNAFREGMNLFNASEPLSTQFEDRLSELVIEEYLEQARQFADLSTLPQRLKKRESISLEFISKTAGWCRARFVSVRQGPPTVPVTQYLLAIEIIDDEKKQQEALRYESEVAKAASEAKGRFLANMSHEIRTPINAVLGMNTMILRESKETQIREYAMNVQNASQTLLSLINDILDFSKIESGKMEIMAVEYDFSSLVNDVMNMVTFKAQTKDLEVRLDFDENLPSGLWGDDVRIRQILVNLLNNAVKYTEKGTITLSIHGTCTADQATIHFAVADTGIGIKEEDMPKLFRSFERIEEARNRNVEGTGLGMSITLDLLRLMDSSLEVESTYGEGSVFSFTLVQGIANAEPVGDLAKRLADRAKDYSYEAAYIAPQAKILVVDDNEINRLVLCNLVKELKLQVREACNGFQALESIKEEPFDLIFLDHMMPDMDGIEVIKEKAKLEKTPNDSTPIIMLTANAIAGAREMYLEAGANGYLAKPIIPERLEEVLATYIPDEKKQPVVKENHEAKATMESLEDLPSIEGVDWNIGMMHLLTKESLLSTVKSFYQTMDVEAEYLAKMYERLQSNPEDEEALDLFRIKVHAMKSSSNIWGATVIGGMAATLEYAARNHQMNQILDVTHYFLLNWRSFKEALSPMFKEKNGAPTKEIQDRSEVVALLEKLMNAMEEFDVPVADATMEELRAFAHEGPAEGMMERLEGQLTNLDVEAVIATAKELLQVYVNE